MRSARPSRCTSTPRTGSSVTKDVGSAASASRRETITGAILKQYVFRYFKPQHKLVDVTPQHVAGYIGWLCKQTRPAPTKEDPKHRVPIADKSVRNYIGPLSACLATAVKEGLIRANPARDADLPNRQTADHVEHQEVRPMNEQELAVLLALIPAKHRVFFRLLAATGLRISEAIALQWRHMQLDGDSPHVKVRRGVVRGTLGPPKTKNSRREVPLPAELVSELRRLRGDSEWPSDEDLVFPDTRGGYLHVGNLRRRVLKPIAEEADVAWVGFHTFRHTCASLLFKNGRNAKQVQHWLGHHSASFTLDTYIKLLDDDLGAPLALPGANKVQTCPTPTGDTAEIPVVSEMAA